MANTKIMTRIVNRNDTAARWQQFNPILLKGELGIEIDTSKIKIGDGVTAWNSLKYISGSVDVTLENGAVLATITQESVDQWNKAQENAIEKIFSNGVELSIVDKTVDIQIPTKASDINAAEADHNHDELYIKLTDKGIANGVAQLDESGKILASQLPGYVDDVIEVANFESLPTAGESGKIYVCVDSCKTYRWSGTTYSVIGSDLALGETAVTAFRGDLGKVAYEHALADHAPVTAQENIIETIALGDTPLLVDNKRVSIPVASLNNLGVVKSSNGANQVQVSADGTMKVGVVSTSTLRVPIGDMLILDGGSSDSSAPVYPTRIGNIGYDSVAEAVAYANAGETVTLMNPVSLDTKNLVISKDMNLDFAGQTLVGNGSNGAVQAKAGTVTLSGDGVLEGTLGADKYSMAVWAENGKVVINDGIYRNATDGSERGTDLIYASGTGVVEINGGTFIAAKPEWTLNCKDADYKAGTAKIIVKGGRFYKFDPSNNETEGTGTNYLAEGYKSVLEGDYYVVKPM